jgi:O-antigen/teichoic acid export membrane protein
VILAAYISIFSVILRLEGKSITYNLITIYGALFNFIILMFLTHKLKLRNVSLYLSQIIMQVFTVTFIFSRNRPKLFILESYKNDTQRDDILLMLKYGFISILAIFSQSLLASSDRYILKIFRNIAEVGIYDRVYNISDRIINLFVSLFLNIFTPLIYRKLDKTEWSFFKEIIPFFLVFIFPLFVYFTLFSEIITNMLLGDNYSSGFSIIPCICAGTVFFSLSSFSEMRIRFQKPILVLIGYIIANICNLVLNFIFIPYYGISGAAITTTLSYIVLFLFFSWKSFFLKIDFYFFRRKKSNIPYVLLVLQIGLHFIFQHFFYLEYLFFIIEALFFCITYYGLIFLLIFKKIITIPND